MEELIDKTIEYVKDYFQNDASGHDFYHTLRVYKLAKSIGRQIIWKFDKWYSKNYQLNLL